MEAEVHQKSQFLKKVGPNLYRTDSGIYYLLVKRGGKQFRRSLKTTDYALAKRRLREFQEKAGLLSGDSENRTLNFEELTERWLATRKPELKPSSYTRRETAVKGLMPFFKGHLVRSIGQRQIEAWKTERGPAISPRSWNIEAETLKQIFAYAKDQLRILIDSPSDSLKRKKQGKSQILVPSKEQFGVLLTELRNGHRSTGEAADLVEFLAYSGCRVNEAINVRWQDVNPSLGTLLITGGDGGTKNGDVRTLPLFVPLGRLLERIAVRKPCAPREERIFEIRSAHLQIIRACERLGLPRFNHHTMRHFFCSNAIEAGCDFKVIAEWLGHKDGGVLVATTYGHLRNEHSAAMAKRITFEFNEPSES